MTFRGSHQKSRTLSDASDKWSIGDRRLSHDSAELSKHSQLLLQSNDEDKNRRHWNDQSPSNRRVAISTTGDKVASSSKVFKSMMTSGHCEGGAGLKQYTPAVFGPPLPPRMAKKKTRKRQKKKSYKSSSSSSSSSRSSSPSSSSTDSTSSSSSSSSSSPSSSSSHSTKKYSKNSGNHKSLQRRSLRWKKNVHLDEKTNRGNRSSSKKLDMKSDRQKKQASQEVDSARKAKDSSECSRSKIHKTSTVYEKHVKRMKADHEDSDDRRGAKSASFSRRRDDNCEAKKQAKNEVSEKKSFVEYSSSSSDNCDNSRSEKKRQKLDSNQIKKETEGNRPAEGETLEDLEQFLQQLKAKKVTAK